MNDDTTGVAIVGGLALAGLLWAVSIAGGDAAARPARRRRRGALPRTWDPLFDRYRARIPLAYMRALTARESNFDPNDTDGGAWGLMQVTPTVLRAYNQRYGTSLQRTDLLDPDVNVRLASDTLNRIVAAYARNHPRTLAEDWSDRRYVELVTAGWNAGWSQARGLQRVAAWLEARALPVTVDHVHAHAHAAGAAKWLAMPQRLRWWKSVASLYLDELARERVA